jgi:SAM-dependent methyltransferase
MRFGGRKVRLTGGGDGSGRRWDVSPEEWERIRDARRQPMTSRMALKFLLRSPRLIPEVARDMFAHAKQGMWESSALVWTLDGERVRGEVPDAARGLGFANPAPFLEVLLPRLDRTQRALDVGGGDGRIARQVAPHVREIVCSDVSPTMVAEAKQNLARFSNASTFLARGYTLRPLQDESFDVAFAQGVLSFIEVNLGLALLDEMHRVLRPGGTLVVNAFTFDRPEWARDQVEAVRQSARRGRFSAGLYRSYTAAQIEAMVRIAGFEIVEARYGPDQDHDRSPYIVVGTRSG